MYKKGEFLQNWEQLVEDAETDEATMTWITDTQTTGECCGWLDADSSTENPAYLNCDSSTNTEVCSDYFKENMSSLFGSFETIAVALASVQFVMVFVTFVLICRLKEFYEAETVNYGDFIKVPFNKIKNVDDLLGR